MHLWQTFAELRASGAWWLIALRNSIAVVVGLNLLNQVRKISRWLGRPFLWMACVSRLSFAESCPSQIKDFQILDIGCGGGRVASGALRLFRAWSLA